MNVETLKPLVSIREEARACVDPAAHIFRVSRTEDALPSVENIVAAAYAALILVK
tara:strand:- start:122 stop:286 length:165 start_codon:yes stop_codon:yes gene_type:complete